MVVHPDLIPHAAEVFDTLDRACAMSFMDRAQELHPESKAAVLLSRYMLRVMERGFENDQSGRELDTFTDSTLHVVSLVGRQSVATVMIEPNGPKAGERMDEWRQKVFYRNPMWTLCDHETQHGKQYFSKLTWVQQWHVASRQARAGWARRWSVASCLHMATVLATLGDAHNGGGLDNLLHAVVGVWCFGPGGPGRLVVDRREKRV